jgi:hypothetical protein
LGLEGVAFHDTVAGNGQNGKWYRNDGPDFEGNADGVISGMTTNFNIGSTVAGEWVEYTVNVAAAGNYDVKFRVARTAALANAFHLEVDGTNVTGSISVPNTGGWLAFANLTRTNVALPAGRHVLRLSFDADAYNNGNFNWMEFATKAIPQPAITAAPAGTNLLLQVSSVQGATYILEAASALWPQPISWTPIATNTGDGGLLSNTVPVDSGTTQLFFRYQVR